MPQKARRSPGAVKGKPKPLKRALDGEFPKRLRAAMATRGWDPKKDGVPRLAKAADCTRAVIHKYLSGESKKIDSHLLFDIADALDVSASWLLRDGEAMAKPRALTTDQQRVLNTFSVLSEGLRDLWMSQGEDLHKRQPQLLTSHADPFTVTAAAPKAKAKAQ